MRQSLLSAAIACLFLTGCAASTSAPVASQPATESAPSPAASAGTEARSAPPRERELPAPPKQSFQFAADKSLPLEDVGLRSADMDPAADPCTDFYQFACGGWLDRTDVPPDQGSYGRFSEIAIRNQATLRRILDAAASGAKKSKLGQFYSVCMDEEGLEKQGIKGILPLLRRVGRVDNARAISQAIGELQRYGIDAVFTIEIDPDFKNPSVPTAFLYQGGLGLPSKNYYFDADKEQVRAAYKRHIASVMKLIGKSEQQAQAATNDVMTIETGLAKASKDPIALRDMQTLYNPVGRKALAEQVPAIAWNEYYQRLGATDMRNMSLSSPAFFTAFNELVKEQPPSAWAHYLQWTLLSEMASSLPKAFVDERFRMRQALTGQKRQRPRWKDCVDATDDALADELGQAFVAEMFPDDAKQAAESIVLAISEAFEKAVSTYPWMDEATKQAALKKRDAMAYLIGYPDTWQLHRFRIGRNFASNVLAGRAATQARELAKLSKPIDRDAWLMSVPTVNAYYHPLRNHMVFPAGILQPPFYNRNASLAVNMGSLGMVVGHELTHGFDDQGSHFDGAGARNNWWSEQARQNFKKKSQCVVEQFDHYEVLPGLHLQGQLTLGENIADMGGIRLAFDAYRKMQVAAAEPRIAGGLTEDQQFFVGLAQGWCGKATEPALRVQVDSDEHAPERFRINGAIANTPAFASAFACTEGSPMNRRNVCTVW